MDWLQAIPDFADVDTVVVVDGGGTASRAAAIGGDGSLLGYAEGGPTNQRSAGGQRAADNTGKVIADAMAAAGLVAVGSVLVSSASVDTEPHAHVLAQGVRRAVGDGPTVAVMADTVGCWAATASLEPAIAVIAGTGSAVLAGTLGRRSQRYGGWDYVLGDEGSGYAMGRAVLRETLLVSEDRSEAQGLADRCWARLGIGEVDELFDAIYKPAVDKAHVASFAQDLLALADEGDRYASRILDDQIAPLADTVAAAFRGFPEIHTLGCFGGIWNSAIYCTRFQRALAANLGHRPSVVFPGDVAMAGSYRIVLRHGPQGQGGGAEDVAVARFTEQLANAKARSA